MFRGYLDAVDMLVFYLIAITGLALVVDLRTSITGVAAAFLAFNFFFTKPYHTFFVANAHDILALFAMLGLSILISRLVVRARRRTREALARGRQTESLYQLSIELIRANGLDEVLESIIDGVQRMFDLSTCAVLLKRGDSFEIKASTGSPPDLADFDVYRLVELSLNRLEPAGRQTVQSNRSGFLLVPIATSDTRIGVLLAARKGDQQPIDDEGRRLLVTFANQAALAIERSLLAEERTRAEILSRTDELKSALLSAVSHDLRTPLASIKASITTLMQPGIEWSDSDRRDLQQAIDEETDRLSRLVENLLDLSRIEAGALKPSLDWYQPSEIVNEAVERCAATLKDHLLALQLPDETTWIHADFVMITQVLINLLENAVKYSSTASSIHISARERDDTFEFRVEDEGVGIAQGEEQRIFDKFYRVEASYRSVGSGMGLAICRGFVEAHGGRIWVEPNAAGGSTFAFTIQAMTVDPEPDRAPQPEAAVS